MTSPAQIALAFCREVMGWEHPTDRKYGERERDPQGRPSKAWTPYIFDYHGKHAQFHYTDLNAVMSAVRGWSDNERLSVNLDLGRGKCWASVDLSARVGGAVEVGPTSDPCEALMAACLAAARRMTARPTPDDARSLPR